MDFFSSFLMIIISRVFLSLVLFSAISQAALFNHIGTCREASFHNQTMDPNEETPLRIFRSNDDLSKGLIAIEFPDPTTGHSTVVKESITLSHKGDSMVVNFDKNSPLRETTGTAGFTMGNLSKSKWIGKHRVYECELGDSADRENLFVLAQKINGSTKEKNKETASIGPYRCVKQKIVFLQGIASQDDPIDIYECFYVTQD